jgi:hypothetical protein
MGTFIDVVLQSGRGAVEPALRTLLSVRDDRRVLSEDNERK